MPGLKKSFPVLLLVTSFTFMNSLVSAENYPVVNPKAGVCILYQDTEFKRSLISSLVKEFNAKEIKVTTDTLSNSIQYDTADYDAVILLSAVEKWRPLPEASDYIIKHHYSGNIVYFSTFMLFNFPYGTLDSKKIDAITSASKTNEQKVFDAATNRIVIKTMGILNKKVK